MDGGRPITRKFAGLKQGLRRTEFNFAGHGLTTRLTSCPAKLNSVRLSPGRVQTRRVFVVRWLILLTLLAAIPARLEAWSGGVIHLPQGNKRPKNGLRLVIDTRWVDANGYRPVRIEAINWPLGPTLADRSIRVVIEPGSWRGSRPAVHVSGQIEIPEGAARGETVLAVPQSDQWGSIWVAAYEDGALLKDVSESVGIPTQFYANGSEAIPSILIIDSDAPTRDAREQQLRQPALGGSPAGKAESVRRLPDVRQLATLFPPSNYYRGGQFQVPPDDQLDDLGTLRMLENVARVELLTPRDLPTRWIDYSCFDLVFISLADLKTLAASQPPVWQALCDWLASGPTLCVYDMELSDKRLAELEALLGLAGSAEPKRDGASQGCWQTANPSRIAENIRALQPRGGTSYEVEAEKAASQPPSPAASPARKPEPFVVRPFYRGRVVAMQAGEPLAARAPEAAWLFNELGGPAWMWYQRHGLSLHRANDDYWNWLVPGIGRAPVGSFLILITAFVIVIGPINYFLLRRRRRLYLLLVSVPLGAALVTLTLFAYALISDGLGVRVRVRSFTEIDQRAGRAVSWSRQSYYAGLAPTGGLTFPETAAVFPLEQYPAGRQQGELGTQWLVWGEGQNLASGYISSRSTVQFLVVESGPSSRALLVESGPGDAEAWATNRLDATIDRLVVKDGQGRTLGTTQLDPGQRRRLNAIDPAAAQHELQQMLVANTPAYPPGYHPTFSGALGFRGNYYRGWSDVDQELKAPTLGTGILERSLQATLNADVQTWLPRSYVALTRTAPGVSLGYGRAHEEASFHVVLGTW